MADSTGALGEGEMEQMLSHLQTRLEELQQEHTAVRTDRDHLRALVEEAGKWQATPTGQTAVLTCVGCA